MVTSVDGHTQDYVDSKCQVIESQIDGIESNMASLQSITSDLEASQRDTKSNLQSQLDSIRVIVKKMTHEVDEMKILFKLSQKGKANTEVFEETSPEEAVGITTSPPLKKLPFILKINK